MKKITLYIIISSLVSVYAYGNDTTSVITYEKLKATPSSYPYKKMVNPEISLEDTVLYGNKTVKQLFEVEKHNQIAEKRRRIDHLRLGVSAGYAYRIAPIPRDLPDEAKTRRKNLREGIFLASDFLYFFNHNIGLGARYSYYFSTNKEKNFTYTRLDGSIFTGNLLDNIHIHYVGPFITLRSVAKKNKIFTNCDFSIGYTTYQNNLKENETSIVIKGKNIGFVTTIGADFMINDDMSLGLNFNVSAASLKKVKIEDIEYTLPSEQVENLSRIGLGLVFKIYR